MHEVSDLSQLWFREFFLELSMGERVQVPLFLERTRPNLKLSQFPIEMSLPWILTKYVLSGRDCSTIESVQACIEACHHHHIVIYRTVFYPLDLYNDSANFALYNLHKQHLYDEVEAEANLAFDQLIFQLSEQVFVYYKCLAGSVFLNANYRSLLASKGITIPPPGPNRFASLFKQRHFQVNCMPCFVCHVLTW